MNTYTATITRPGYPDETRTVLATSGNNARRMAHEHYRLAHRLPSSAQLFVTIAPA